MWFCAEKCWEIAVSFTFLTMFLSAAGGLEDQYRSYTGTRNAAV